MNRSNFTPSKELKIHKSDSKLGQTQLYGGEVEKGNMIADRSSWGEDLHY